MRIKFILASVLISLWIGVIIGQAPPIGVPVTEIRGSAFPNSCNNGDQFYNVLNYHSYRCGPANLWTMIGVGANNSIYADPVAISSTMTLSTSSAFIPLEVSGASTTIYCPNSTASLGVGWGLPITNVDGSNSVTLSGNGLLVDGESSVTLAACSSAPCFRYVLTKNSAGTGYTVGY